MLITSVIQSAAARRATCCCDPASHPIFFAAFGLVELRLFSIRLWLLKIDKQNCVLVLVFGRGGPSSAGGLGPAPAVDDAASPPQQQQPIALPRAFAAGTPARLRGGCRGGWN